jgi:hypothetical protein
MTTPVWADLEVAEELPQASQERYDTGNIYGISEATGVPELLKYTGNATANLSNINGAVMTTTMGAVNISPAVNWANQANNYLGTGVMQVLKTEGSVRSIPDHVFNMFRLPGTPPNQ